SGEAQGPSMQRWRGRASAPTTRPRTGGRSFPEGPRRGGAQPVHVPGTVIGLDRDAAPPAVGPGEGRDLDPVVIPEAVVEGRALERPQRDGTHLLPPVRGGWRDLRPNGERRGPPP